MADTGLSFLFDIAKDLVLSADVTDVLFRTLAKLATQKLFEIKELVPVPEDASPEKIEEINGQNEMIKADNANNEVENARITKIKTKISIGVKVPEDNKEQACIRLANFRQDVLGPDGLPI